MVKWSMEPVFEVADTFAGAIQNDYQAGGLLPDGDLAVPGIGILTHVFFEWQ